MSADDEARAIRGRLAALDDDASRRVAAGDPGAAFLPCVTAAITSYPTTASAFYGVRPVSVGGTEAEGAGLTFPATGAAFLAANLGTQVPQPGTRVRVWRVPHRWVFSYSTPPG